MKNSGKVKAAINKSMKVLNINKQANKPLNKSLNKQVQFVQNKQIFEHKYQVSQNNSKNKISTNGIQEDKKFIGNQNKIPYKAKFAQVKQKDANIDKVLSFSLSKSNQSLNVSNVQNLKQSNSSDQSILSDKVFIDNLLKQINSSEVENQYYKLKIQKPLAEKQNFSFPGSKILNRSFLVRNNQINSIQKQQRFYNTQQQSRLIPDTDNTQFYNSKFLLANLSNTWLSSNNLVTKKLNQLENNNSSINTFPFSQDQNNSDRNQVQKVKESLQRKFQNINPEFGINLSRINIMQLKDCNDIEFIQENSKQFGFQLDSANNTMSSIHNSIHQARGKGKRPQSASSTNSRNTSRREAIKGQKLFIPSLFKERNKKQKKIEEDQMYGGGNQKLLDRIPVTPDIQQNIDKKYKFNAKTIAQNKLPIPDAVTKECGTTLNPFKNL